MNILILGLGNMGGAMASALCTNHTVYAVDPIATHDNDAVTLYPSIDKASEEIDKPVDVVILTVKPQILLAVLETLASYLSHDTLVISSVAGVSMDTITQKLNNPSLPIARFMPNIAAKTRESMTGLSYGGNLSDTHIQQIKDIAHAIGQVVEIPEELMSAITGVSGSGIAFVAKFIEAMTMAGVREGLHYQQSYQVSLQTIRGALSLLEQGQAEGQKAFNNPSEFISSVCSPMGTTIEGISALETHNITSAIFQAVHASKIRSDELQSQNK